MSDTTPATLRFTTLEEAVVRARHLHATGYERGGQWSLGQACWHLTEFMTFSLDGFPMMKMPWPITAIARALFLNEKKLSRPMPKGMPTVKQLKPAEAVDDAAAVDAFAKACARVSDRVRDGGQFATSPLFGQMPPEKWHRVHLSHAQHHLGLLREKVSA